MGFVWVVVLVFVPLAVGIVIGRWADADRRRRSANAAGERTDMLERMVESGSAELEQWKRRANEYFKVIEGIERERDEWRDLHYENLRTAANAQTWCMREIERLLRVSNHYARKLRDQGVEVPRVELNAELRRLVETFGDGERPPRAPGGETVERPPELTKSAQRSAPAD